MLGVLTPLVVAAATRDNDGEEETIGGDGIAPCASLTWAWLCFLLLLQASEAGERDGLGAVICVRRGDGRPGGGGGRGGR